MRVVSWNMNHCMRTEPARAKAWSYLRDVLRADVALVQEAVPPSDVPSVYRPIDATNHRYNWGSAIVALSSAVSLRPRTRWAIGTPHQDEELPDSHPGASAVADLIDAGSGAGRFTAVSIYGRWEYMPDGEFYSAPTVHRVLSDLTHVFARGHKTPVLLAGDLNATTQVATANSTQIEIDEARVLFERIRALGLHDLIALTRESRQALPGCSCPQPDRCSHVRTYRDRNRADSRPTQLDYAFGSHSLVTAVRTCRVCDDDEEAWSLSDHCPIVLDIE